MMMNLSTWNWMYYIPTTYYDVHKLNYFKFQSLASSGSESAEEEVQHDAQVHEVSDDQ